MARLFIEPLVYFASIWFRVIAHVGDCFAVSFNSVQFWIFFAIAYALYLLAGQWRKLWICIVSFLFYASWSIKFVPILLTSALTDYWAGHYVGPTSNKNVRLAALATSMSVNLLLLCVFKYMWVPKLTSWFVGDVQSPLTVLGNAAIPVGISFYTFQTMSYTIDIYRGVIQPAKSLLDYLAFVTFFPQLVAGPIEKAKNLLPQLEVLPPVRWSQIQSGICLIIYGLFKKIFVADALSPVINTVFLSEKSDISSPTFVITSILVGIKYYADFSGYSDIAMGLARFFGIQLTLNFKAIYFSVNPIDMWRRWHISLTDWVRDYLFLSVVRINKKSRFFRIAALLLSFFAVGLWHSDHLNWICFGLFNGFCSIGFHYYRKMSFYKKPDYKKRRILFSPPLMWIFFSLNGVFIGANDGRHMLELFHLYFNDWTIWGPSVDILKYAAISLVPMAAIDYWKEKSNNEEIINAQHWLVKAVILSVLLGAFLFLDRGESENFIYFNF